MKKRIKEVGFNKQVAKNFYFDLVDLEDIIFKRNPTDHSQFNHHKLSFYAIIIITHQAGQHSINYKDYPFKRGTVFTIRKSNIHKFYQTTAKGKLLVFTEDFIIRSSDKTDTLRLFQLFNELLGSPKLQLDNNDFIEMRNLIFQIEQEYLDIKDDFSVEIIRSLIQVLILKLFRIKSKGKEDVGFKKYLAQFIKLQDLVEKEGFESKSVSYYANKMFVSTRTLNNITQSVINKSAKAFIDEIVILQIKRLLINSTYSYTEIAFRAGFEHSTNFFKYFRKMTGLSPKEFKEKHQ